MASIYQRGRVWWVIYYDNKRKIQHSLKTRDKTVAKFKKNEIEQRLAMGDSPLPQINAPIDQVIQEFLANCKVTSASRTVKYYDEILKPFVRFLAAGAKIQNVNDKIITDYLTSKPNIRSGMTWHIIKVIKTFLNFAVRRKYLSSNPVQIKKPKQQKRAPECWTLEETKRILAAAKDPTARTMINFNLYVGLRPAEMTRLRWDDIDFQNEILTVREAKDKEFRRIPLHPEAVKFLSSIKKKGDLVFSGVDDKFFRVNAHRIRNAAKVKHIKKFWYSIRHTFATEYYKQTGDLRGLQEILGHSSIEMTTVYVNPQEEHRKEQLRRLSYSLPANTKTSI